jgi:glutathione S-transferase
MKLYYSPGACSLSPHIAINETGLAYEKEKVDLKAKKTETGADFHKINPKGYIPALLLDDGQVLTEGAVIAQYLADLVPEKRLAPPAGTMERYRLHEWLNYIGTEVHKSYGPLFNPAAPADARAAAGELLKTRFRYVSSALGSKPYLTGETFTVADAYLFTMLNWTNFVGIDLSPWPNLQAYMGRVAARPAVQATLKAEGLT